MVCGSWLVSHGLVGVGSTEEELNQGPERRPSAGEAFGRQNGVWPEYVSGNIEKQLRDRLEDKSRLAEEDQTGGMTYAITPPHGVRKKPISETAGSLQRSGDCAQVVCRQTHTGTTNLYYMQ